jgi:RHS repeat-associated protein
MQNIDFLGSWKLLMRLIDCRLRTSTPFARGTCQAILFFAVLSPVSVGAQSAAVLNVDNTTQTPIFGVGHDYIQDLSEIVNPANGSLSIRVQAPTPQDRGWHDPTYAMSYDSTGQLQFYPTYISDPTAVLNSPEGYDILYSVGIQYLPNPFGAPIMQGQPYYQGISSEIVDGPLMYQTGTITEPACSGCAESYICTYGSNFVFTDSSGGLHSLPIRINLPSPQEAQTIPDCGVFNMGPISQGGDGIYTAFYNSTTSTVYVVDNHGDVVASTGNSPVPAEDTNGNYRNGTGRTYGISNTTSNGKTYVGSVTVPGLGASYRYTYPTLTDLPQGGFTLNPVLDTTQSTGQVGTSPGCPSTFTTNSYGATSSGSETLSLPNGQSYTFGFDSTAGTGNISSIKYPTGAKVTYTWGSNPQSNTVEFHEVAGAISSSYCFYTYDYPAIQSRIVSYDGVNSDLEQDFQYVNNWNPAPGQPWKQTTVTTTDLKSPGKPSYKTIYTYTQGPGTLVPPGNWGDEELVSPVPMESSIVYKGTSGETLKTVQKSWTGNNQLGAECTTIGSNTAGVFYQYAGDTALVSDKAEYDYGLVSSSCQRPSGTPTRETATTYQSFGTTPLLSLAPSILDRPCSVIVYGNGVEASETDYFYDGASTATVCGGAGTPSVALVSPSAINHDETNYSHTSPSPRGNLTAIIQRCLQGCSDSLTQYSYDETGQVVSVTDPDNHPPTTYSYVDNYASGDGSPTGNTNTYVKTVTRPSTNGTAHTTTYSWGFEDGKMRSSTDVENSATTTYCYFTGGCSGKTTDPWARLTEIEYPDGGITVQSYNDAGPNPYTVATTQLNGSESTTKYTVLDAYGHPIQTQMSEPNGADVVNLVYDGFGQVYTATNPFLSSSQPSSSLVGTPAGTPLTTHYYDALGRPIETIQQDGKIAQTCYNGISSSSAVTVCSAKLGSASAGTWVDSSDEVGNHWQRTSDALGRLTQVMEPNGSTSSPTMETDYSYNALNNLLQVNQHGLSGNTARVRNFTYDSLSRLVCASNPETSSAACPATASGSYPAGVTSYNYDGDGNVVSKVAPAPNSPWNSGVTATTTYQYDALNRKTYELATTSTAPNTLTHYFYYDFTSLFGINFTNPIGNLSFAVASFSGTPQSVSSATMYWNRDAMGRVKGTKTCTPATCNSTNIADSTWYNLTNTYDLAGNMTSYTDGFGTTISSSYDTAGRLSTVSTTGNGTTPTETLWTANSYSPIGLTKATFGSNLAVESLQYTNRMTLLSSSTVNSSGATLYNEGLTYYPNLNVNTASDSVNGNWTYTYDTLNRLSTAVASNVGEGCQFAYDPFGNRTSEAAQGSGTCFTPTPFSFTSTATNHIDGYCYDAAGNLLDPGPCPNTGNKDQNYYDGFGNLLSPNYNSANVTSYTVDALGQRIAKWSGSAMTNQYLYGADGQIVAEMDGFGNWVRTNVRIGGQFLAELQGTKTYYRLNDHLGTLRAEFGSDGCLSTYTSLPFGDGQTTVANGCADSTLHHFTGKERDAESGLDNFGARYFGSSMGRFMSPDSFGGHYTDPQTLNRYSYVRNNPLRYTDPTGHDLQEDCKQTKDNHATCGGSGSQKHVGTTDAKGKFNITHFQTDASGSLAGHDVSFNTNGVHIDGNNAEFISGTDPTRVNGQAGTGWDQTHFVVNSNCNETCAAGGAIFGSPQQLSNLVHSALVGPNKGLDGAGGHEGDQYRGGNKDGPDMHLSFIEGRAFDSMHFDGRYPYGSVGGFADHAWSWMHPEGHHEVPLPQDINPVPQP